MGELVVVRVNSLGPTVTPTTGVDSELVERLKMVARASRKLARLWGSSDSRVTIEWRDGRAILRVGEEDFIAIITYNGRLKAEELLRKKDVDPTTL